MSFLCEARGKNDDFGRPGRVKDSRPRKALISDTARNDTNVTNNLAHAQPQPRNTDPSY